MSPSFRAIRRIKKSRAFGPLLKYASNPSAAQPRSNQGAGGTAIALFFLISLLLVGWVIWIFDHVVCDGALAPAARLPVTLASLIFISSWLTHRPPLEIENTPYW